MKAALLIIDVQTGLVELIPRELRDQVLPNIAALLQQARSSHTPVIFIQHDGPIGHPLEAGTPGWAIHPAVQPLAGEAVIRKQASDSFFETTLASELQDRGITHLIITGGMSERCVDTTCRRAITLGYDVTLVSDGHLTRNNAVLSAPQVIAHHNLLLDGFAAGTHAIKVKPAEQISL